MTLLKRIVDQMKEEFGMDVTITEAPLPTFTCALCDEGARGYGNNPFPLLSEALGRCCDDCNQTKVIPARFAMLRG